MIFVDTSAIYALADREDPHHAEARKALQEILASEQNLLTHSYILVESFALVQRRLGVEPALKLAAGAEAFDTVWVDADLHHRAIQRLRKSRKRQVSLVDHVSFIVMADRGVHGAFAFDPHFEAEGFALHPPRG